MEYEYCIACGNATGRAGAGDDSIYDVSGKGPYCVDCIPQEDVPLVEFCKDMLTQ